MLCGPSASTYLRRNEVQLESIPTYRVLLLEKIYWPQRWVSPAFCHYLPHEPPTGDLCTLKRGVWIAKQNSIMLCYSVSGKVPPIDRLLPPCHEKFKVMTPTHSIWPIYPKLNGLTPSQARKSQGARAGTILANLSNSTTYSYSSNILTLVEEQGLQTVVFQLLGKSLSHWNDFVFIHRFAPHIMGWFLHTSSL